MEKHIVQSDEWGKFKNDYGTPAVNAGGVLYTKHAIPLTAEYFAYCPKVDPTKIDFAILKASLDENKCVNINFDVPNVIKGTEEEAASLRIFEKADCVLAPKDQFAKSNVLLDISPDEDALLANMHHKHRYNIKYSQKNGVHVRRAEEQKDFDIFWKMFEDTSIRQHYYIRPRKYYETIWNDFKKIGICDILIAEKDGIPLASWMLFIYNNVLYYPYGGSSEELKNLHGSTFLGWEAIRFGKEKNCKIFDMWGASENPENVDDPWYGFTNFKLKYGGKYVTYMDSYDFVVNKPVYKMFSVANDLRWKILKLIK